VGLHQGMKVGKSSSTTAGQQGESPKRCTRLSGLWRAHDSNPAAGRLFLMKHGSAICKLALC
jgi:hypothetical protein